jgi:hypothetical protein
MSEFKTVLSKRTKRGLSRQKKISANEGRQVPMITTKTIEQFPTIDPHTAPLSAPWGNADLGGITVGGEPVHQHGVERPHQKPADGGQGGRRRLSNASWDALKRRTKAIL